MRRIDRRRIDKRVETPELIGIVLGLLSLSSFITGITLNLVEMFDSAKHGIESDGDSLWRWVFIVISIVLLIASFYIGCNGSNPITNTLLVSTAIIMMILVFCMVPRYAVSFFGNVETNMESIIEDKGFSDVDVVMNNEVKKKLLQEFDNPDKKSAYPNQLATAHKDGNDYVLLIGFKGNKEAFIQEKVAYGYPLPL